ncbi:MAG TPA: A/G-specific adenine glycosylase [Polyangiaceae bacterium]|jgi:A/G-specific adenine glycosylase
MVRARLRTSLLDWYARTRRDLPWRRVRDPYAIWVSETMLQQTRVETVIPYYERFMRELPTMLSLAEAPEERVLALWSGLGYYRRARMLHAAAKQVAESHGGRIPEEAGELLKLEGVGRYTAGAIASIAFGRRAALVDGNVARVLSRLFAIEEDVKSARGAAALWRLAEELVAGGADPGDWNQALMELGATVCSPREPKCGACPVRSECAARERGLTASLPRSERRAQPISVRRAAVVLASCTHVLLARRRADTSFGGLWEPPSAESEVAWLASSLGIDVHTLQSAGEVTHLLTHRRMHVDVVRGELPRKRKWSLPSAEYDAIERVALAELGGPEPRAVSSLARKVLIVANIPLGSLPWKK